MTATLALAPFDAYAALAAFGKGRTDAGGLASFIGLCRAETDGAAVATLWLDHYPGFTEAALDGLEAEARRRWALLDCLVVHRAGEIFPGEAIVLVAALSAHRAEALAATQFLIDALKTDAPFWKRETGPAGVRWIDARTEDAARRARWSER
jgi:molybdopterin synthase catalytic subunit